MHGEGRDFPGIRGGTPTLFLVCRKAISREVKAMPSLRNQHILLLLGVTWSSSGNPPVG